MSVLYPTIRTKISETDNLQTDTGRCRRNTGVIMPKERNRNNRGRMLSRPYPYARENSTKVFSIRNSRISQREECSHDI